MTTVLYFQASGKVSTRQKLEGVYAYGREHGWNVQVIEPGATERKAAELVEFWMPNGVIVECGSEQNTSIRRPSSEHLSCFSIVTRRH